MQPVQYRGFTTIRHRHTKVSRQVIGETVTLCNMPQDLNLQNNTDCKQNNSAITPGKHSDKRPYTTIPC